MGTCVRGAGKKRARCTSPLGGMHRKRDLIAIKRHRRHDFEGVAQLLIVLEGHNDAADGLAIVYPMFVEIAHVPQDLAEDDIGCE